jgi:hypothetical protein
MSREFLVNSGQNYFISFNQYLNRNIQFSQPDWLRRKRGKFRVLNSNKNNSFRVVVANNDVIEELKTSSEN